MTMTPREALAEAELARIHKQAIIAHITEEPKPKENPDNGDLLVSVVFDD